MVAPWWSAPASPGGHATTWFVLVVSSSSTWIPVLARPYFTSGFPDGQPGGLQVLHKTGLQTCTDFSTSYRNCLRGDAYDKRLILLLIVFLLKSNSAYYKESAHLWNKHLKRNIKSYFVAFIVCYAPDILLSVPYLIWSLPQHYFTGEESEFKEINKFAQGRTARIQKAEQLRGPAYNPLCCRASPKNIKLCTAMTSLHRMVSFYPVGILALLTFVWKG